MKKVHFHQIHSQAGFGLTETLVALSAGALVIAGGALTLRTTGGLINQSSNKSILRQNTTNGMRLLRAEVERSLHIIVNNSDDPDLDQRFKLDSSQYSDTMTKCQDLAVGKNTVFQPIFGIKMATLNSPIIYGYGISPTTRGYDIVRCGAPIDTEGKYVEGEVSKEFLSVVIDQLGVMGCAKDDNNNIIDPTCDPDSEDNVDEKLLSDVLQSMGPIEFSRDTDSPLRTPVPTKKQPALRVETDSSLKLVKFIDPNPSDPNIQSSYLQIIKNGSSVGTQPLYLAAFARADKRLGGYGDDDGLQNITIFKDITSKHVRFVLDGSGSMSACILWGDTWTGEYKKYYSPDSSGYITTTRYCHITRMETLQQELRTMVSDLSDDTNISLEMFSAPGGKNHEQRWELSKDGLIRIGGIGVRESALNWVNTLDDVSNVGEWGGTIPWPGLSRAFGDTNADTVYFLSDGQPNSFSDSSLGGEVSSAEEVVSYYALENNKRASNNHPSLVVNAIALGIESNWMEDLSTKTGGNYMQYDRKTLSEVSE